MCPCLRGSNHQMGLGKAKNLWASNVGQMMGEHLSKKTKLGQFKKYMYMYTHTYIHTSTTPCHWPRKICKKSVNFVQGTTCKV